jgi:subtilisin family serine protease
MIKTTSRKFIAPRGQGHRVNFDSLRLVFLAAVLSAPLSALAQSATPNDPFFASKGAWGQPYADQWALPRIGFAPKGSGNSAWDIETGLGHPVIVAVLDTGIDYHHPDFAPTSLWRNPKPSKKGANPNGYDNDQIGWNFVLNNNHPWDNDGHGTFVAGIIGAATNNGHGIAGINWGVQIMSLKVMNAFGKGRAFNLARAIIYAVDHDAKVINLSVEGEKLTRTEQAAVDYAYEKGALIVIAAGNQGADTSERFAGFRHGLPVAALDMQDKRIGFSNWGKHVRIAAPGMDILSLRARRSDFLLFTGAKNYKAGASFVGPQNQFMRSSGTSFAAPLVSGVASLIWAKHPNLSNAQLERMLIMSADDVETPGWDQLTGYGRLNARKALEADPDYYLYAELHRLAPSKQGNQPVIQAFGTVGGSHFGDYRIEVGEGENPTQWRRAGNPSGGQIKDGLLGILTAQDFGKAGKWSIRIVAQDSKGQSRESRLGFDLH